MGVDSLALRISGATKYPLATARDLLKAHKDTYPAYWAWSQLNADHANLRGFLQTVLGFHFYIDGDTKLRTETNFPVQGNGSELLRLACCLATERGIQVCAPVHDAILIGAPLDRLDSDIKTAQEAMREASEIILGGFSLRTDVHVVRYPDRYMDKRGVVMWEKVTKLIGEVEHVSMEK
jgi:DNA polymerase-1